MLLRALMLLSAMAAPVVDTGADHAERMTVDVRINGQGPYPFVVDTGSENTVVATELADRLGLADARMATLHSLDRGQQVRTVSIERLAIGDTVIPGLRAPTLAAADIGAQGILGIDSLSRQRVILDFRRGALTILPATRYEARRDPDEIVVRARSRFGRLVLADADVGGHAVNVIIDTGAQISIGNPALGKWLAASGEAKDLELISVTGGVLPARYHQLRSIRIGDAHLDGLPIAIADAHIFHALGLTRRPALLLGINGMRGFERVSVDFANRRVRFRVGNDGDS